MAFLWFQLENKLYLEPRKQRELEEDLNKYQKLLKLKPVKDQVYRVNFFVDIKQQCKHQLSNFSL